MALVADTSVVVAALIAADDHHTRCARLLEECSEPIVIPAATLPEIDYFCERAGRRQAMSTLLEDIRAGDLRLEPTPREDVGRISELLETYRDLNPGFVDAAVLAIVERLGEVKLATLDHRHFATLRPRHAEALELLPG